MPSLIDRINSLFRRQPVSVAVTSLEIPDSNSQVDLMTRFRVENDRRSKVDESGTMYDSDPRVKQIIQTVARDTFSDGFEVVCDDEGAKEIADETLQRLNLEESGEAFMRSLLRDGDLFLEIGIDSNLNIVSLSRKPTLEMRRNSDRNDAFPDPSRAFWQADSSHWGSTPPKEAIIYAQWQIVHARWDWDMGKRYGSPLFSSAREPYKRLREGEIDMAIRRKLRAGMKLLHTIEGASAEEIKEYKRQNQQALNNPMAAATDFFSNKAGSLTSIQGDANLGDIVDVEHHLSTFWIASPVPMALIGYGQNLNRDIVNEQKEQYDETLAQIRNWAAVNILQPIITLQWLLKGIYPDSLVYDITTAKKETITAPMLVEVATAIKELRAAGVPDEIIKEQVAILLPTVDISKWEFAPSPTPQIAVGDNQNGTT